MLLIFCILNYLRDCKEIGKENLAVPLSERLFAYFLCFILPIILVLLKEMIKWLTKTNT